MEAAHLEGVVALQRDCFPAPFPEELLWQRSHLEHHLRVFPEGQFVAWAEGRVIASASATRIGEAHFQQHLNWEETVGGFCIETFDAQGSTLYGLDISVHPSFRRLGIGRQLLEARFRRVTELGAIRYATGCRLPDFALWAEGQAFRLEAYLRSVELGKVQDRTLTPMLRYGLSIVAGLTDYMDDPESLNCAALLEKTP